MSEGAKSTATTPESNLYKLRIRRDSWLLPFMFLLAAVAIFALYALPSGELQFINEACRLADAEALLRDPNAFEKLEAFGKLEPAKRKAAADAVRDFCGDKKPTAPTAKNVLTSLEKLGDPLTKRLESHPWEVVSSLGRPLIKVYFTKLAIDFRDIIIGSAKIGVIFILCALIPGLAGFVYRRRFWIWFGIGLVVLIALNASGVMGTLMVDKQLPRSGELLIFIVSQVVLLLLALRLRRHTTGGSWMPLWLHNGGVALILTFIGVACLMNWGHQYGLWWFLDSDSKGLAFIYRTEFIVIVLPLLHLLLRNSPVWPARRGKNIVICLDGTTNTPDQMERGFAAQTNVFKLFKMLKSNMVGGRLPDNYFDASLFKKYGDKQVAFYYAGVGNTYDNNPIMQVLGGATGLGAHDIIDRAYLDIVRVYRPHDRVFIVGFSRGAAIARLLARTIDARKAPSWIYTMRLFGRQRVLAKSRHVVPVQIDVLGCFDTVGSFGVAKTIGGVNFQQINMGLDMTVPDNVERAYHMVALDEQRDSFEPTLMEPDPIYPESIVEVWFSGDHANIGGGWATDNLSDITMDFLLRHVSSGYLHESTSEAAAPGRQMGDETWGIYLDARRVSKGAAGAAGVDKLRDDATAVDPRPTGEVRHWFSNLYKYRPRTLPIHAVIHDTVFERIIKATPVYAPEALFKLQDRIDELRASIDEKQTQLLTPDEIAHNEASSSQLRLWRWSSYEKEKLHQYKPEVWLKNSVLDAQQDSMLEAVVHSLKKPRAATA
jgi:hypothetical protein